MSAETASLSERAALWDALLEAEYQRRYWYAKSVQTFKLEKRIQIFLACSASATVVAALGESSGIAKGLALISAVLAVAQPFLDFTRASIRMGEVSSKWHCLQVDLEAIWRGVDDRPFPRERFEELLKSPVEIEKGASELPSDDEALQNICYQQVFKGRGLQ